MTHIQWTAHRDDEKIGTVENIDDREAARMIDTGLAVAVSEPVGEFASPTITSAPTGDVPTGDPTQGAGEGDTGETGDGEQTGEGDQSGQADDTGENGDAGEQTPDPSDANSQAPASAGSGRARAPRSKQQ